MRPPARDESAVFAFKIKILGCLSAKNLRISFFLHNFALAFIL